MERVAIFGVGLIGGSFALALRRAGYGGEIVGVSSPRTIAEAVERGIVDRGADAAVAAREADFVYLSQPVLTIIRTLEYCGAQFRKDALVTDAGSTKARVVETARRTVSEAMFVGGHPLAGKERRGVLESDAALFEGRKYVVTPLLAEDAGTARFRSLIEWIGRIGAEPVILDPDAHDRLVAQTSHVPQLLSTALASLLSEVADVEKVAGPAALEFTRLGASPFDVWSDILATNQANIDDTLAAVLAKLNELRRMVGTEALRGEFERAAVGATKLRGGK